MAKSGLGEPQIRKARKSREAILTVLSDNKPHRYNDVVEKTKLSTATVSKVLKKLEKEGKIEKKIDIESGEYPYPVYYKLLRDGIQALTILRQINFMDDSFIQTTWPQEWIKEAFWEIINETYKKKFRLERLRSKEARFFHEVLKKEVLEIRIKETNLTIFHKGLLPFRIDEYIAKVTIELMLDLFINIVGARKDENEPVMLVLSYIPTAPKEDVVGKSYGYFVSWCKQFKGVDAASISKAERDKLSLEYALKFNKYHRLAWIPKKTERER